ncbi:cholesterol 7-desaturase nvd-like [Diachasmimorpha longicaudata]|uniref:cholesterol 7-desaturase nvd-like n=1 Tax=Diachasmimorpha longicaudata TaxID=58733 RepID=UPI0030B8E67A
MITWWQILAACILSVFIYLGFFWEMKRVVHVNPVTKAKCMRAKLRNVQDSNPVYPNGWYGILHSHEVEEEQVKNVNAIGETFAVYRTREGHVHVIDAYCPHLGANMAEGGRVVDNCLLCPFHDWSFGPDGRCNNIPYTDNIPPNAKVRAWKSLEVNNIIFVWYHAEMEGPEWYPQPIAQIADKSYWCQGRNEYIICSQIQEVPENGSDSTHLSYLHGPGMFFPGLSHHTWSDTNWQPRPTHLPEGSPARPHQASLALTHVLKVFGKFPILKVRVTAEQIGPAYVELTVRTCIGKMFIIETVTPIEPFVLKITHSLYAAPLHALYAKIVFLGQCLMFERDNIVWSHKEFLKNPVYTPEDKRIKAFRQWYKQFYSPNSPTYQSIKSLDW